LDDHVAIVTGGALGIGRAHSLELARRGAHVVIVDPGVALDGSDSDATPAAAVVAEIEAEGGSAEAAPLSVTDYDGVGALVERIAREHGHLDIVVNNAGITRDRVLVNMQRADWYDVLDVHLGGTFNLTRHAATHWRERHKSGERVRGRIINTASGAGMRGGVGQAAYGAAKAAIAMLTTVSAMELGRYGVTANAISPVARTRMTEAAGLAPARRPDGEFDPVAPENSSAVVAYLASDAADWITGQTIRVDGNQLRFYNRPAVSDQAYSLAEERRLEVEDVEVGLRALFGVLPLGLGDQRLRINA